MKSHIAKSKAFWITVVILVIAIIVVVIITDHSKSMLPQPLPLTVTTQKLNDQVVPKSVQSYGITTSPTSVKLRAQVDAVITAIHFKPGQQVKKGQLLFSLRATDVDSSLAKLKATMVKSRDTYLRLLSEYRAYPGGFSRHTLVQAKLAYSEDLAAYQQSLVIQNVKAPINGVLSDTNWVVGDFVSSGTMLANLVNLRSVQLKYQLPSNNAQQVKLGQQVLFYPNASKKSYLAYVVYIGPLLNKGNYNLTLRADFYHPSQFRPNLFGRVQQIINAQYRTLAISQQWVETDSKGYYIYTIENHKIAKRYFVPEEITNDGFVTVRSGLKKGLPIVTSNLSELSPGQYVKVVHE